jgi:hypothetical protein
MSRWPLPRPVYVADDNDLFLVNVLMSAVRAIAKESMGEDGTPEEVHGLFVKLVARGYREVLYPIPVGMSEDGIEDFLTYLRKELRHANEDREGSTDR